MYLEMARGGVNLEDLRECGKCVVWCQKKMLNAVKRILQIL